MKNKSKAKEDDDPHPIEYYEYIKENSEIWCENPINAAKPVPTSDPYLIKTVLSKDTKTRKVTFKDRYECQFKKTLPIINGKTIDVDDMAAVKDINEVDLLYNLLNRLKEKKTFTNVGPTLLIVNPFTRIEGVYGEEQIEYYLAKQDKENPEVRQKITEPHLYDLVLIAIRELLKKNSKNQALVISGESGAGKTEATKNAMKCITYFFGKNSTKNTIDSGDIPLETKILNCNPILEAFGNAKTVRNDNSSRFGKYVKIKLNSITNIIEGAEMDTYLLEKSRISELNEKERNYHVFYFLLRCGDDQLLSSLYLNNDVKSYKYLYTGEHQVMDVPTIDDKACFIELTDCFKSTGFSDEDITNIFRVVAAVLLLGNVRMKIANDKCIVENIDLFQNICQLLDVDPTVLQTVLSRKPPMPGRTEYGGVYSQQQVKSYIDALAKELYNRLFLWIVTKLNAKLDKSSDSNTKYIGLLDIFGFECFDKNSLEQLCINYTNEQLQQLYIKDIFENDKAEFRKEGLDDKLHLLDATYKDNKDIIRLIKIFFNRIRDAKEDKNIFDIVVNFQKDIDKPPKGDKTFAKIKENHFKTNKFNKDSFTVDHTAKSVLYLVMNMVEKNKDETKPGVVDCILASKNNTIQLIFTNTTDKESCEKQKENIVQERTSIDNNKIKNRFLGMKFSGEMKKLKTELKLCDHHYVRCLKPNEEKKALLFHPNFVFNQIQYLGILATIQVRKSGFPMRSQYKDFYENYKLVLTSQIKTDEHTDYKELTKKIIIELIGEEEAKKAEDECLYGNTKIYLKQGFSATLENTKQVKLQVKVEAMKKMNVAVNFLKKKAKIKRIRTSIDELQKFFNSNKTKIALQKKKEKIRIIQAAYFTRKENQHFEKKIENYKTIQNSIRMLLAKSLIQKKQTKLKFLSYQLQFYMQKIKEIHRIKMRKVAIDLLQRAKDEIFFNEYNNLWQKLNPFFISLLARKKHRKIAQEAKKQAKHSILSNAISLFQHKLFIYKVNKKKIQTKKIFSFASSIMFSNYYIQMRKKVLCIQKYLHRLINKQNVFKKINQIYFIDNDKNLDLQNINILKTIFPNWIGHSINAMRLSSEVKGPNSTKNTRNNISFFDQNQSLLSREIMDKNLNDDSYYIGKTEIDIIKERKRYTNSGYINSITGKKPRIIKQKMKKPEYKDCIYPKYDPYSEPQIVIFAKILDIDILSDDSENSDKPWCEQFMKIYRDAMENQTPIQIIKLGNCHSMAINSRGKVYSWGWNNYGQCGVDPSLSEIGYLLPSMNKDKCDKLPTLPVLNYLQSGNVINASNINRVVIGDDYSFVINDKGTAVSYGNNYLGQLGFGHCYMDKSGEVLNQFKNNIVDMVTTENSNVVLTKQNEIFTWYLSKDENLIQPTKVYMEKKVAIDSLSAGKNFVIILSKTGICYGLGSNERGELGLETKEYRIVPEEITPLMRFNIRISQVRCGFKHVVCIAQNGNAYGWGNNSYGQLGQVNKEINEIIPINIVDSNNTKERIVQVAAGFRSSFFMTDKRDIYFTGVLSEGNQSFKPIKFSIKEKSIEVGNETEFAAVRILCTYNRNMSIFYASMADVRSLSHKFNNRTKVNEIVNALAEKWTNDSIEGPFISHISRFFSSQFMKVIKKTKK